MPLPRHKAVGERGSWFAEVNGERLPCFHRYWVKGAYHHSRGGDGSPQHRALVAAIRADPRIVLTSDRVGGDGSSFERTGYIAVFRIANIEADDHEIRFDLIERLAELD